MFHSNVRRWRLRSVFLVGVAAVLGSSPAARAQNNSSARQVESVTVTGSILPQLGLSGNAPLQVVSADDMANSGLTSTEDILRSLTANSSGTLPSAAGAVTAHGGSNVSLRGLLSNSTLVLINGERTASYPLADDGVHSFVDLNTIPQDAIDHIEVLKDGASSIYGADAVAGVVNIIMRKSFQGVESSLEGGTSQHGGGDMTRLTGRFGYGDLDTDRFNFYLDFEWERDNEIKVGQRNFPFNQFPIFVGVDLTSIGGPNTLGGPGAVAASPGKTATVYPVLINNFSNYSTPTTQLGPSQPISNGFGVTGTCGAGSALGTSNPNTEQGGSYCYTNAALDYLDQPLQEHYNIYGHGTFKLWPKATATLDASYAENDVTNSFPGPQPQASTPVNTNFLSLPAYLTNGNANPNNPFVNGNSGCAQVLPAGQTEATAHSAACPDAGISYLFPIRSGFRTQSHVLRVSAALNGNYEGWTYTLTGVAAHSWLYQQTYGNLSLPAEVAAINDGTYNFVNPQANSQALLNSLAPPIATVNTSDIELIDAQITHDLVELPGGMAAIGFGAGARHEQAFAPNSNPLLQQGSGSSQIIGSRNVFSAYSELSAPILKTVEVDVSGRFDHYSDAGNTFNPKFGGKWTPIPEFNLRATYSTGFAAPSFAQSGPNSVTEQFNSPFQVNLQQGAAAFSAAHNNDAYVSTPYALGNLTAGNPQIRPQTSHSYTFGAVLVPDLGFDLSATVDYYYIKENNLIAPVNSSAAVGNFFAGQPLPKGITVTYDAPDPLNPAAPLRPAIFAGTYTNNNSYETDGIDVELRGATDLPFGINWSSDLNVTKVFDFWYYTLGSNGTVQKQGWVGTMSPTSVNAGGGTPRWMGSWSNTFTYDKLSTTFTAYYHSGMYMTLLDVGATGCQAIVLPDSSCTAKSFTDLDMTTRYQISDRFEVFGTIKNVLDARPPLNPLGDGPDYNPAFDQAGIVGRYFKVGVRFRY